MDWGNLIADKEQIIGCHYTAGRQQNIRAVVLHHNAGTLTTEDCYRIWQSREASAHYQVEIDGTIGQLVNDWDTAWHAGDANPYSIGIEHANNNSDPWTISDATLEAGAHLTAAVCLKYGLGEPTWGVNVFGHSHFMATACPGEIAGSQNAAYMQRAKEWYQAMAAGTDAPAAAQTQQEATASAASVQQIATQTADDDFHGGKYQCNVAVLNVRDAPSLSGKIVAEYNAGETVNLDDWYTIADGYVWARYTAYTLETRYIAVGPATGKAEADDYLIKC